MENLNAKNLETAIKNIDPAKAETLAAKYKLVMDSIGSGLVDNKLEIAKSSKSYLEGLASDLISNSTMSSENQNFSVEALDRELDNVASSLGLKLENINAKELEASFEKIGEIFDELHIGFNKLNYLSSYVRNAIPLKINISKLSQALSNMWGVAYKSDFLKSYLYENQDKLLTVLGQFCNGNEMESYETLNSLTEKLSELKDPEALKMLKGDELIKELSLKMPGTFKILTEPRDRLIGPGTIILTAPDGTQRYLRPGANPVTGWQTYKYHSISTQEITDNRKVLGLPETLILGSSSIVSFSEEYYPNLVKNGFYQVEGRDGKTLLMRQGKPGTYTLNLDSSVTYTWPNGGKSKLKPGGDPDKNEDWQGLDNKGIEAGLKTKFKNTLESQHFYYSEDGKLRREGYNGFYTVNPDQTVVYTWPNGGKSLLVGDRDPSGNLADDKWEPLDDKAIAAREELIDNKEALVNIGSGQYISLERARESGFAKPSKISDPEIMLNQFTEQQKMEMLKALLEGKELSDQQKQRLQQIGILRAVLQTLKTDVKTNRTWAEWGKQAFTEFDGTTNARVHRIDNMIQELDLVASSILENPNKTVGELVSGETKRLLLDNELDKFIPYLMDDQGRIKESKNFNNLQAQYFGLVQFLRDKKDYAGAQTLIEDSLLGVNFAKKRAELNESEKKKARSDARKKITKMAAAAQDQWDEQGLTEDQQSEYIKVLVEQETNRNLNKVVAEMNNGLPFNDAEGWDAEIMRSYKDMMGTGAWHNLSDSTWDTILEEVIINAPLILASGGVAAVAREGLTVGARALVASARLTRIGRIAVGVAEGLEAGGSLSRKLYVAGSKFGTLAGSVGGVLFEGAVFETVYSGLHGENLFQGGWAKFPEWGKRILWSAASLGTFHVAGEMANKVNNVVLKYVTKFPDKAISAAIQKLIITGSIETAAMLGIGAAQHYAENGNLEDWKMANELLHALVTVGALKIVAGAMAVGKKRFFPSDPEGLKAIKSKDEIDVKDQVSTNVEPTDLSLKVRSIRGIENVAGELKIKNAADLAICIEKLQAEGFIVKIDNDILTVEKGNSYSDRIRLEFEGTPENAINSDILNLAKKLGMKVNADGAVEVESSSGFMTLIVSARERGFRLVESADHSYKLEFGETGTKIDIKGSKKAIAEIRELQLESDKLAADAEEIIKTENPSGSVIDRFRLRSLKLAVHLMTLLSPSTAFASDWTPEFLKKFGTGIGNGMDATIASLSFLQTLGTTVCFGYLSKVLFYDFGYKLLFKKINSPEAANFAGTNAEAREGAAHLKIKVGEKMGEVKGKDALSQSIKDTGSLLITKVTEFLSALKENRYEFLALQDINQKVLADLIANGDQLVAKYKSDRKSVTADDIESFKSLIDDFSIKIESKKQGLQVKPRDEWTMRKFLHISIAIFVVSFYYNLNRLMAQSGGGSSSAPVIAPPPDIQLPPVTPPPDIQLNPEAPKPANAGPAPVADDDGPRAVPPAPAEVPATQEKQPKPPEKKVEEPEPDLSKSQTKPF